MGVDNNIGHDRFPKQGTYLGRRVEVCFDYDTAHRIGGQCVRDDVEPPGLMILRLDDGRVVLSTECQYRPLAGVN